MAPEAPRDSQRLPEASRDTQRLAEVPRGSENREAHLDDHVDFSKLKASIEKIAMICGGI
jgi:hypothetical protein